MNAPQDERKYDEFAILGYLIAWGDPALIQKVFEINPLENFGDSVAQTVGKDIRTLAERGEAVDLVGLAHEMKKAGTLAGIGGAATLAWLLDGFKNSILTETRLFEVATELAAEHRKREAQREISSVLRNLESPHSDITGVADSLHGIASTLEGERRVTENPFISSEDLLALPPTEPIVKGLLSRGDLCILSASYGQGKSFLALDMGISISQEKPWFGMKTKASPLVYVNLEGHLGNRVRAWRHAHGEHPPFTVFEGKPFDVRDKKFIDSFIKHCPPRAVVIVDTLAIAAGGLNLDRPEDLAHIYGPLRRIAREINGAVIVVAHLGKDDTRGAAGSHQIEAQADAVLVIDKNRNIEIRKARDGEKKKLGGMSLEVVHLGEDADGDPVSSCCVAEASTKIEAKPISENLQRVLEEFKVLARNVEEDHRTTGQAGQNGIVRVSVERWREHFYRHDTHDKPDSKLKAFNRARADLVNKGLLVVSNDFYHLPDTRTTPDTNQTNTFLSGTNNRTYCRTDTDTPFLRVSGCPALPEWSEAGQ